jgi:hypothetical protein
MRPIKNTAGDIWKVVKLAGWDRTRDSVLCNDILSKRRTHYSMGAMARDYRCSICNGTVTKGNCEHLVHGDPTYKLFDNKGNITIASTNGAKLAYWNVVDPKGFEISSVTSGAFVSSHDTGFFTPEDIK